MDLPVIQRRGIEKLKDGLIRIADWVAGFIASVEERPVLARVRPGEVKDALPASPPVSGESMDVILADFEQDYSVRRTPYLTSRVWTGLHDGRAAARLQTEAGRGSILAMVGRDALRLAHGTDERITVENSVGAVCFYVRLIRNTAG
mgnify:CR=1 FL=1